MAIKAPLKIILHAGDTVVAESDDELLWRRVLEVIDARRAPPAEERVAIEGAADDPVERFARQLGVGRAAVVAACAPSTEPPYLRLSQHAWDTMKAELPARGPGSIPRAVLPAALLVLWSRSAGIASPTLRIVHAVLRPVAPRDKNAARAMRDARWLRTRDGKIMVSDADVDRAVALARAFCTGDWRGWRRG